MNTVRVLLAAIIVIGFPSCGDTVQPGDGVRFGLFLLRDASLTTMDVQTIPLDSLTLDEAPFISYDDIIAYERSVHRMYLRENPSHYFLSDSDGVIWKIFGTPFVVVAGGERIYLGSFYTAISSWLPGTPMITDYQVDQIGKSLTISPAPLGDSPGFIDVREDERILTALRPKLKN